jgi:hypothetical protein
MEGEQVEVADGPTFHLFPKLAPELRTRIWGFATPDPAVIV